MFSLCPDVGVEIFQKVIGKELRRNDGDFLMILSLLVL